MSRTARLKNLSSADLEAKADGLPDVPGVYIFISKTTDDPPTGDAVREPAPPYGDALETQSVELYVGKAKNIRKRVKQYFDVNRQDLKTAELLARAQDILFIECESETEAFLLENRLIKDIQPPFNIRQKSGQDFPVVEIAWAEDFPTVRITRDRTTPGSAYHGPYISSTALKSALAALQPIFKWRTCNLVIRDGDDANRFRRPCLQYHIGRCDAPCAGRISKERYRDRLKKLARALAGHVGDLIRENDEDMKAAAAEKNYERAAELRDLNDALRALGDRGETSDRQLSPDVSPIDPAAGCASLQREFNLDRLPARIEGVDIAHLQGEDAVGAIVAFFDGKPDKERYRRFRIRLSKGNDDLLSIAEVVRRRVERLVADGEPLPDILLIDGGPAQLAAATDAIAGLTPSPIQLCALAKKDEIVFTADHPDGLKLSRNHNGLRLLMRVRDEAHRFARHYHHILRRKRVIQ
ncbi:MAG: GIY-YIG nuclease family protein [Planctomycetota bacterium]